MALSLCCFIAAADSTEGWVYKTDESSGLSYWALDVVYCENPLTVGGESVQHLAIYAPATYLRKNADGTVVLNPSGSIVSSDGVVFTAETAPIIYANNSGGYSSSSIKGADTGYLSEGYIHVSINTRGKETKDDNGKYIGQFPALITDLKAGIRYLKANDAVLPGNSNRIISVGGSSGGAVSAMLGTSGNSPVFDSYLKEIGAADATNDIFMAVCWCPITNLNTNDAAYEWFMSAAGETWFNYDSATGKVDMTLDSFIQGYIKKNQSALGNNAAISRNKMCSSLDSYNYRSNEGDAFVDADGNRQHFSKVVRDGLKSLLDNADTYGWNEEELAYIQVLYDDYAEDISEESEELLEIMSPIKYVTSTYQCDIAPYFRWKIGSADGDQGAPAGWLTHKALQKYHPEVTTTYGISWAVGHDNSELKMQDLYTYIASVLEKEDGLLEADPQMSFQTLQFEDSPVSAQVYNIAGYNYFKLRDIAQLLKDSSSKFSIDYDTGTRTVSIATGKTYNTVGGELETGPDQSDTWVVSNQSLYIDGVKIDLTAINIGGFNYFKLRDLAAVLGFGVDYDETSWIFTVSAKE